MGDTAGESRHARPGTWHDADPDQAVPIVRAKAAWAKAARPILEAVATEYHATITYQDLSGRLQDVTGFRTRMLFHYWIGEVLGRVSRSCHEAGEPLLSSLCVDAAGSVGPGYAVALEDTYGDPAPADLDEHAAAERLRCYQHFGAELPAGGGVPALTPQLESRRRWQRREAARTAARPACPTCHLQLPATGLCDYCS